MFIDFREGGHWGRERKRKKERERGIDVKNIDWLPLIFTPTGDRTHSPGMCLTRNRNPNPLVYGMMLQPTEPHWPRLQPFLLPLISYLGSK